MPFSRPGGSIGVGRDTEFLMHQDALLDAEREMVFGSYVDRPVVCITQDDGLKSHYDSFFAEFAARRPLVGGYGLISNLTLEPRSGTATGDSSDRLSISEAVEMHRAGHELLCHSASHASTPSSDAHFDDEVIDAQTALRAKDAALGLAFYGFIFPGSWLEPYDPEARSDLRDHRGRVLRAYFAQAAAYILPQGYGAPGMMPLPHTERWGGSRYTIDPGTTQASLISTMDLAAETGWVVADLASHGIQAAFSDNTFGALDHLLALERAERIYVMTPTGARYARPGLPVNLLVDSLFTAAGTSLAPLWLERANVSGGANRSVQAATGTYQPPASPIANDGQKPARNVTGNTLKLTDPTPGETVDLSGKPQVGQRLAAHTLRACRLDVLVRSGTPGSPATPRIRIQAANADLSTTYHEVDAHDFGDTTDNWQKLSLTFGNDSRAAYWRLWLGTAHGDVEFAEPRLAKI